MDCLVRKLILLVILIKYNYNPKVRPTRKK